MKAVKVLICCFFLLFLLVITVYGEPSDDYSSVISSTGADELYDNLDKDVKAALDELGINNVDFSSIFDISLSKVFNLVISAVTGKLESPVRSLVSLLSVIILIAIGECFIPDDDKYKLVISVLGTLFCVSVIIKPLYTAMESAVSSVSVCAMFVKGLIPVLTGVISASGNATLALSFQSVAFYAAQIMSAVSEKYIVPMMTAIVALDITSALIPAYKLNGITELVKKTVIGVMSFSASLYVSFLGIKGVLSNAADTVANKGIKLVISSAVPVVGGAISEAYSGIIGTLLLVKSTVGIFGIIVIAVISVPAVIQLLFWAFALKIGAAVGEMLMQDGIVRLMKALGSAVTLLNVVLLFNGVLFIISLALIISFRQ